ncbi:hypothetical protein B0H11DRAFT_208344 [Mycena galericulata]|nr:hypothetical protein B0H11DRAFT_208344 [Mycena galericulata]
MICFISFAVALGFIRSAAASPFVLNAPVTVYVTAATCTPTASVFPIAAAAPSPAILFAGDAASSAVSAAGAVVSNAPSVGSSALAASSSSSATSYPSLVTAAKGTRAAGQAVITSVNALVNITERILQNSTNNSIPIFRIIALQQNSVNYATDLATLSNTLVGAQAKPSYRASIVASLTTDVITLTTQIRQLQPAGTAFNEQFTPFLQAILASLQGVITAFAGTSNVAALASAVENMNATISALQQPLIPTTSVSAM